jgi:hypothetical protein
MSSVILPSTTSGVPAGDFAVHVATTFFSMTP